ncbi:MAG: DUF302 domain-containing protein [Candidatus Competibacteraceae bacterium]
MLNKIAVLLAVLFLPVLAWADSAPELIKKQSAHDVKTSLDRLEEVLKMKDIIVISRIDHAANAEKVGMELRPTALLIFGNPKAGTVLQMNPAIGVDLPMKALAWEDENGQTWLVYTSMEALANRHGIDPNAENRPEDGRRLG